MAGIPVPFEKYIIILLLFTNSFILCSLKELFPVGVNPKVDFFLQIFQFTFHMVYPKMTLFSSKGVYIYTNFSPVLSVGLFSLWVEVDIVTWNENELPITITRIY